MTQYVDGFVVPVPKAKVDAYRRLAKTAGKIWREYGALAYVECIADDVNVGKRTSFPRSVKLKARLRSPATSPEEGSTISGVTPE